MEEILNYIFNREKIKRPDVHYHLIDVRGAYMKLNAHDTLYIADLIKNFSTKKECRIFLVDEPLATALAMLLKRQAVPLNIHICSTVDKAMLLLGYNDASEEAFLPKDLKEYYLQELEVNY